MTAPTPDLAKMRKTAEGGWFATAAETLHVLDALAALTAERDQARQMLADAPHDRHCESLIPVPSIPGFACDCWKAGL